MVSRKDANDVLSNPQETPVRKMRIKPEDVVPVRRVTREEAEEIYPPDERQAEQEARAYALSKEPGEHIRPRDLQAVSKGAVSFNAACRVLEGLEKDGELVRTTNPTYAGMLVWLRARPATTPSRGYALPLSQKEHGALLDLLDFALGDESMALRDARVHWNLATLRAIRQRLKRPA